MVHWLGLHALTAEGHCSVAGWGTKIPQAAWDSQKKKKESKKKKKKTQPPPKKKKNKNSTTYKIEKGGNI